jgi:hypothetical protein
MLYDEVPTWGQEVALYKALEATAGPDEKGRRRKGSQIWNNGLRAAEKSGRAVPETKKHDNGQMVVDVAKFAEAMMFAPTTRCMFVGVLRQNSEAVLKLYQKAGLNETDAATLLQKALVDFIEPLDAVLSSQQELAALFQRDPATLRLRCYRYRGQVWIFSNFDGIAMMLSCSPDDSCVRMAWDAMTQRYPELKVTRRVNGLLIPQTHQFEGAGERQTPVLEIRGFIEMLLLVPSGRAAPFRRTVVEVFVRRYGGDTSMMNDILAAHLHQNQLPASSPSNALSAALRQRVVLEESTPSHSSSQEGVMQEGVIENERSRKRPRAALTDIDDRTPLHTLTESFGLEGRKQKVALMQVSLWLVEAIGKEKSNPTEAVAKMLNVGAHGQRTLVPPAFLDLAKALLKQWCELDRRGWSPSLACEGPPVTPATPGTPASAFCAEETWHASAKDQINQLWIEFLLSKSGSVKRDVKREPVFYLDAFEQASGFALRTTGALKKAGFERLFLANPDEGICRQATAQQVQAFRGTWAQAADQWNYLRFQGFYFDFCKGDKSYTESQLEVAMPLAAPGCVLAVTVLPRCYDGWTIIERSAALNGFFTSRGWSPAAGPDQFLESLVVYRNGSNSNVFTQMWVSPV